MNNHKKQVKINNLNQKNIKASFLKQLNPKRNLYQH